MFMINVKFTRVTLQRFEQHSRAQNQESIEVGESIRAVLMDIRTKASRQHPQRKAISPLTLPSLNTDLYRLPTQGDGGALLEAGHGPGRGPAANWRAG